MWHGGVKMKKYIVFLLTLLILTIAVGYIVQGASVTIVQGTSVTEEGFKNCVTNALEDAEDCLLKEKTKAKDNLLAKKDKVADCRAKAINKLNECS
jgi:hypothetical protein